ncbi:MAG TPA: CPBP family intramembrane glutamic endopeptidase [Anaerolineales bacterium]|nr:CPBP family intramembrane glutamic endopeptidase [Anaerolineales bacterium]
MEFAPASAGLSNPATWAWIWQSTLTQKVFGLQQPAEVQLFRSKGLSAMLVIGIILAGPILEEYAFRGLILHNLVNSVSVVAAIFLSAALFSLYHLSAFQLLPTFFWGIGFAVLAQWAESLWPVVIAHLLVNGLGFALFMLAPPKAGLPSDGSLKPSE